MLSASLLASPLLPHREASSAKGEGCGTPHRLNNQHVSIIYDKYFICDRFIGYNLQSEIIKLWFQIETFLLPNWLPAFPNCGSTVILQHYSLGLYPAIRLKPLADSVHSERIRLLTVLVHLNGLVLLARNLNSGQVIGL